ncbi:MAG: glycosyl hydrolase [Solirubrobacterales bacterium]
MSEPVGNRARPWTFRLLLAAAIGLAVVGLAAIGLAVGLAIVHGDSSQDSTGTSHRGASGTPPPERTGARRTESPPWSSLGVYTGAADVSGVKQFADWLRIDLHRAVDFINGSTWSTIESPTRQTRGWANSGYRIDFGLPMIPASGGSLAAGARGAYNSHFVKLGENLIENGQADAIIRPGWEFNAPWFRWHAGSSPGAYVAYYRQIVNSMRSVRGQRFEFEWNPALGKLGVAPNRAYPGDRYVDYVGLDVYDQSWIRRWRDPVARWKDYMNQPYGLRWQRDFAAQHGKPMTFPEWGLTTRPDGHGGGDNPYFISRMYEWIRTNNVAAQYYFDFDAPDGRHELTSGEFPRSAARFRQLFGAGASP